MKNFIFCALMIMIMIKDTLLQNELIQPEEKFMKFKTPPFTKAILTNIIAEYQKDRGKCSGVFKRMK